MQSYADKQRKSSKVSDSDSSESEEESSSDGKGSESSGFKLSAKESSSEIESVES